MNTHREVVLHPWLHVLVILVLCGVLLFIGTGNPKLFHLLAELASIVIAFSIFLLAWPSRRLLVHDYLLFFGFVYLTVGSIDLAHTISYKGMGILVVESADPPTQLWIIARYIEALALLFGPYFLSRRLPRGWALAASLLTIAVSLLAVFHWKVFPSCFQEGSGLTPFKIVSEYIIIILIIAAIIRLRHIRTTLQPQLYRAMLISMVVTILGELSFTLYRDVYGVFNILGHVFKIISFYYIYRALIVTGLTDPLDVLFRDLKKSNERLQAEVENREMRERQLQDINEELETAREHIAQRLRQLQEERGQLLNRISGTALRQSDMLQDKSRLVKELEQCNEEKEVLHDQLEGYLRIVEQFRSGIGSMLVDGNENS